MQKIRKKPQRMCMACREMRDKRQLLRVVRTPQGQLELDRGGRLAGRGAYLCCEAECWKRALKSHAIERALGVKPQPELVQQIEELIAQQAAAGEQNTDNEHTKP